MHGHLASFCSFAPKRLDSAAPFGSCDCGCLAAMGPTCTVRSEYLSSLMGWRVAVRTSMEIAVDI